MIRICMTRTLETDGRMREYLGRTEVCEVGGFSAGDPKGKAEVSRSLSKVNQQAIPGHA